MLKKYFVYPLLFSVAFVTSLVFTNQAEASIADLNFRWNGNTAYFRNYNTDFPSQVVNAATKYNNQTDLNTSYVTTGGSYRITWYQGNYGSNIAPGRSRPYNGYGQPCADMTTGVPTGYCTTSGNGRANRASIYLNSYYIFELSSYRYFIQLHEAGHAFGMGHAYCDDTSVMTFCYGHFWSALRQMDIDWINAHY